MFIDSSGHPVVAYHRWTGQVPCRSSRPIEAMAEYRIGQRFAEVWKRERPYSIFE